MIPSIMGDFEFYNFGCGSTRVPIFGNSAVMLRHIKTGNAYLFDCGYTVCERMLKHNLFEKINDLYVIITHYHDDHIGSLAAVLYSYIRSRNDSEVKNPNIVTTQPDAARALLAANLVPYEKKLWSVIDMSGARAYRDSAIELIPVRTSHRDVTHDGYILHGNGVHMFLAGDSESMPDSIIRCLMGGELNYIYTTLQCIPGGHFMIEDCEKLVPAKYKDCIIGTHLSSLDNLIILSGYGYTFAGTFARTYKPFKENYLKSDLVKRMTGYESEYDPVLTSNISTLTNAFHKYVLEPAKSKLKVNINIDIRELLHTSSTSLVGYFLYNYYLTEDNVADIIMYFSNLYSSGCNSQETLADALSWWTKTHIYQT